MGMDRRQFLGALGGAASVMALPRSALSAESGRRKPNIVFIMADDLGYGHLGRYGQEIIRTPNIDQLAAEGMRFTQVYAGCSVCAPCRSVLMTGLHMGHTSVRANSGGVPLRDDDLTVAEVLKASDYATGCFGKWGLGDAATDGVPTKQGFDEFFGYLHQVHAHFYYPEYLWHNDEKVPLAGNAGGKQGQYTHDEIVERALAFIRANKDRPFFCYLPVTIPHAELIVPAESLNLYSGKFEERPYPNRRPGYAVPREPKATLAAMITHMDKSVGQVMALLKELGIDDNTIVFFTSDNGASGSPGNSPEFFKASGPLRDYKGSMYEGGIRAPMIARWPGRIKANSANEHVWYFADVMPTLAELAGAKPPKPGLSAGSAPGLRAKGPPALDGISVVPTLLGEEIVGRKQRQHEYLYWELGSGRRFQQALRMGDWKAVRPKTGAPLELYDLSKDIGEKNDVATAQPDVMAKIEAYLKTCRSEPRPQIEPEKPKGKRYR